MFREYDIRGRVSEHELNEKTCQLIGQGFGTFLKKRGVGETIVGFDAREYSERLKNALVQGIVSTGVNVTEIGQVLVPIAYFAQEHLKIKGVAMVTASHNPNGWSGFKLGHDFETTLLPDDIQELYQIISEEKFEQGRGEVKFEKGIIDAYTDFVLKKVNIKKPLKVVVNAGNGTAGPIVPPILNKAGCQVVEQFCDIDFSFPHHEPNPAGMTMLQAMADKVKQEKADVAFGFDGDGDRLGMTDEKGQIIWPDRFMILLARRVLQEKPGAKVVFDVKCSQALIEDVEKQGGIAVMHKTGHSYIKQKAKEVDAALAGERSGHIFYRQGYFGYDDAVFASLKFLEYLSLQDKPLSEIMLTTPQYVTSPTWHAPCADEVKYEVVERLVKELKEDYGQENVIDINGARVKFDDGWGLVRASSNLPVLVLIFESKTEQGLKRIENIFRKKLAQHPEISPNWTSG